jgi:pimeloyl-ACP methyl ester carboxylesterase
VGLVFERRGSGEPLVLLHGLGSRWQVFAPVLDTLAEQFEVFAVDMPGFGASPALAGRTDVLALTGAIEAWIADQGLDRPHVAGNSTGGGVALELADRGAVRTATGLAPIGFWSPRERAFCQASMRSTRMVSRATRSFAPVLAGNAVTRTLSLSQFYARPWALDPDDVIASVNALVDAPAFDDVNASFAGYLVPATAADHVPVTVAWGAKDRLLLPRQLERARHRLPRARHVLLPHAGHIMMADDPPAVAAVIAAGTRAPAPA